MTISSLHDALFTDVAGYNLSSIGKAAIGREADPSLTYGEVTPEAVAHILAVTGAKEGEVFYDLGSGTGKMVVYAAYLVPLKKSAGIELLPELHLAAAHAGRRYESEILPHLSGRHQETELAFIQGDLFEQDYSDADIVVSHCCTCFDDDMMQKLTDGLEKLKSGARIATITRTLPSPSFLHVSSSPCEMGWGQATVHVYRRK